MVKLRKEIEWETNEQGCHLVTSHRLHRGRPYIKRNGKSLLLYRWLWEQAHGSIPEGMVLMHSCDNPRCINLEHLSLGTQADNVGDMIHKERKVNPYTHKELPIQTGNNIREFRNKKGMSLSDLASEIGVSKSYLSCIELGKRNGSVQIMKSISTILGVSMDTILED
jgi:DNA-binding XRE family transcriptional regulator